MPTHQSLFAGLCGKYLEVSGLARLFCQLMMVSERMACRTKSPLQQRASHEQCTHYKAGSSNKWQIKSCWVGRILQGGNRVWACFRWEGDWIWVQTLRSRLDLMTGENDIACAEPLWKCEKQAWPEPGRENCFRSPRRWGWKINSDPGSPTGRRKTYTLLTGGWRAKEAQKIWFLSGTSLYPPKWRCVRSLLVQEALFLGATNSGKNRFVLSFHLCSWNLCLQDLTLFLTLRSVTFNLNLCVL